MCVVAEGSLLDLKKLDRSRITLASARMYIVLMIINSVKENLVCPEWPSYSAGPELGSNWHRDVVQEAMATTRLDWCTIITATS